MLTMLVFIMLKGMALPAQLCESLMRYLAEKGVQFHFNHDVEQLQHSEEGWTLSANVSGKQQQYLHQTVVIANGHLLTQFQQTQQLPVTP